jgi:glycyl-tRNA synthetase beta chain
MSELLLEIFSEEIPARMQDAAAANLLKLVQGGLLDAGYSPSGSKAFATPRRLSLVITGLSAAQENRVEERKGPKLGAPEKAISGFLKSAGLSSVEEAMIEEGPKGSFYVARREIKGRATSEIIAEIVTDTIHKFPWPKAMRWGAGDLRWVRPLHSILCCFDGEVVEFEIAGVKSGDLTYGHRFMAGDAIQVRSFENYIAKLAHGKVILDGAQRREHILGEAKALCQVQGLELVEDEGLLREIAGLAEWPVPLMGSFDEKFLQLPDEVLIASMRGHQKYFSVRDPKTGRLANKFIIAANMEAPDGGAAMRIGYERVLTARLSDGWFLYQQDLKIPLEDHAEKLRDVTFFEGLGSIGDKVERIAALAREIAPLVGADPQRAEKAARLAKADLVTAMVGEFPELQGLMGWYYAKEQGVDSNIADAIRDHYKPAGQGDEVPSAPISVAVALADKIDTLMAFWSIDEKPTGSKDPFALRRAALGVIRIIFENEIRLPLKALIHKADTFLTLRESGVVGDSPEDDLLAFFHDRLKVYLRDKGYAHSHVDAVRMRADGSLEDDLVLIVKKLEALSETLKTDEGTNLLAAYKRAGNILKAEEKRDKKSAPTQINAKLLKEPEEKALMAAMEKVEASATPALEQEDFTAAMTALATLRQPLDDFFEKVTVNDDDKDLRANRLALLKNITMTCNKIADLSKIEG